MAHGWSKKSCFYFKSNRRLLELLDLYLTSDGLGSCLKNGVCVCICVHVHAHELQGACQE